MIPNAIIDRTKPHHPKILPAVSRVKQQQQLFSRFILLAWTRVRRFVRMRKFDGFKNRKTKKRKKKLSKFMIFGFFINLIIVSSIKTIF